MRAGRIPVDMRETLLEAHAQQRLLEVGHQRAGRHGGQGRVEARFAFKEEGGMLEAVLA
jgi:hypothetical protein